MASFLHSALDGRLRTWQIRIARASELQARYETVETVLGFYSSVLEFQRDVAVTSKHILKLGLPLGEQVDLAFAVSQLPALLSLAIKNGPEPLAQMAESIERDGSANWHSMLETALTTRTVAQVWPEAFFARACLQPIMENLQSQLAADPNYSKNICPACGALPQAAVLHPEGDGARRSLLCSLCLREWIYRRVVCPWCGEEDKERLPRYSAEGGHIRVEACDTCKRYLKSVDLSLNGNAVPVVDEVALAVLDVWAADHGYTKIYRNLMGF